jgi:hypothetical protein
MKEGTYLLQKESLFVPHSNGVDLVTRACIDKCTSQPQRELYYFYCRGHGRGLRVLRTASTLLTRTY